MSKNLTQIIGLAIAFIGTYLMIRYIGWGGYFGVVLMMWANNMDYQKNK